MWQTDASDSASFFRRHRALYKSIYLLTYLQTDHATKKMCSNMKNRQHCQSNILFHLYNTRNLSKQLLRCMHYLFLAPWTMNPISSTMQQNDSTRREKNWIGTNWISGNTLRRQHILHTAQYHYRPTNQANRWAQNGFVDIKQTVKPSGR